MTRVPIPNFRILWQRHQALYIEVFSDALLELAQRSVPVIDEDQISEKLCPLLTKVCRELSERNGCEIRTPVWQAPIQPVTENDLKGGKKNKKPDFFCSCINPLATSDEEYEIPFHIECKRIGTSTSNTWILNENYINNGIKRFDDKIHEYGKRASSGMMIGYIVSMQPEDILAEINEHQQKILSHNPSLSFTFGNPPVFKSIQNLERENVNPSKFILIHLWADLKKSA